MFAPKKYTILQKLWAKCLTLPGKINLDEWWANREVLASSVPEDMCSHFASEQSSMKYVRMSFLSHLSLRKLSLWVDILNSMILQMGQCS